MSDPAIVDDADKEDWVFEGVVNAAVSEGSGRREKLRELRTDCRGVRTEVPACLIDVVRMPKCSFKVKQQLWERD